MVIKGHPPFDGFGHPVALDLINRYAAGQLAIHGQGRSIYSVPLQILVQQQVLPGWRPEFFAPYISPPVVAYLYAPFAMVSFSVAAVLWISISTALLFVSFRLIWPLVPVIRDQGVGTALIVIFASPPVRELLLNGQDSAISLLLLVLGLRLLLGRRDLAAGAILGLGAFKPQLFLFIPLLLLLQRRWAGLWGWGATTLALVVASAALAGSDGIQAYITLVTSDALREGISVLNWKMDSLVALARAVFGGPVAFLGAPFTAVIDIVVLALFFRAARRPTTDSRSFSLIYALAVLAGVVASPYLFVYDCTILILPAMILLNEAPERLVIRLSIVAAYLFAWSAPLLHIAIGTNLWPLSTLAGPWAAVPIAILAFATRKIIERTGPRPGLLGTFTILEIQ
jgi:hypothetical protein